MLRPDRYTDVANAARLGPGFTDLLDMTYEGDVLYQYRVLEWMPSAKSIVVGSPAFGDDRWRLFREGHPLTTPLGRPVPIPEPARALQLDIPRSQYRRLQRAWSRLSAIEVDAFGRDGRPAFLPFGRGARLMQEQMVEALRGQRLYSWNQQVPPSDRRGQFLAERGAWPGTDRPMLPGWVPYTAPFSNRDDRAWQNALMRWLPRAEAFIHRYRRADRAWHELLFDPEKAIRIKLLAEAARTAPYPYVAFAHAKTIRDASLEDLRAFRGWWVATKPAATASRADVMWLLTTPPWTAPQRRGAILRSLGVPPDGVMLKEFLWHLQLADARRGAGYRPRWPGPTGPQSVLGRRYASPPMASAHGRPVLYDLRCLPAHAAPLITSCHRRGGAAAESARGLSALPVPGSYGRGPQALPLGRATGNPLTELKNWVVRTQMEGAPPAPLPSREAALRRVLPTRSTYAAARRAVTVVAPGRGGSERIAAAPPSPKRRRPAPQRHPAHGREQALAFARTNGALPPPPAPAGSWRGVTATSASVPAASSSASTAATTTSAYQRYIAYKHRQIG